MSEADALCSRIGILAGGRLRAIGSQQALKHRYGSGYRLTLALAPPRGVTPPADAAAALDAAAAAAARTVARLCPDARLARRIGATAVYALPRGGGGAGDGDDGAAAAAIAATFAALDAACRAGDAGFADFGLNQTSLEEVFVNVVEGAA